MNILKESIKVPWMQELLILFKENKNNELKVIGIYAKRARGLMIRYMIDNRIEAPELLKQFNTEGYQFAEELSSDSSFVFTRDI